LKEDERPAATLFEGARLIVGDGRTVENGAVLVEGDTITRVGAKGNVAAPKNAMRVDLAGKTIMPGVVLAHGHIGYLKGTTFARENYTRDNLIDHLNRYLYYGVVAMMSTGTASAGRAAMARRATACALSHVPAANRAPA